MKNLFKGIFGIAVLLILISGCFYNSYANDLEDDDWKYTGPGVSLKVSDYDHNNGKIYSYGIGPISSSYDNNVDLHYVEPMTIESTIVNPINNSLIDMGPKSASNAGYTLHFINDAGPGMDVITNELGKTMYYNDGGPGFMVSALNGTDETLDVYVDKGPVSVYSTTTPENYLVMLAENIPSNGEGVYRSYKKNTSASTK